ncbi:MAG: T9SS type A sorting domain-containing protein [Bacteroidota bacterium]
MRKFTHFITTIAAVMLVTVLAFGSSKSDDQQQQEPLTTQSVLMDCEDFDALTPGGYVAGQLGGYWTTWGGAPGGADDAFVTDANSNSPSNSFAVDAGAVDLIYQLGDAPLASGMWMYSHYMFVPAGFSGYFNVQTEPTPGVGWNLDLYFDDGGTGHFDGQSTELFDYTQDVWFMVEILYDLDGGMGYVYFDGVQVLEFVNAETIGGIDYYGADAGGAPGAYYDDVCFGEYTPPPPCENFDALEAGGYVAGQLGGYWTTWGGAPGGADDAFVTDVNSNSPDNSFVVDAGAVDLILQLGDDPIASGMWMYSHYMFVPSGFSGYFNVQTEPTPGVGWNLDLYFDDGGTGHFDGQSTELFDYTQDVWFMVEILYDLDGGMGYVYFDGVKVLEFVNGETIGGIDYYGADAGGAPGAYYDDVCFGEYTPPPPCEDFDALEVGGYVAGQLGGYWTTWGGTPGGADDAFVTDVFSNSPSNSFVVDAGAVDLILQLGDEPIATGQWLYSNYIYVPTGFSGYFNVQEDPEPGVGWNLELNFADDGTGYFEQASTETFEYDMDTWFLVEINYDFDAGLGGVWFDGELITIFENTETIGGIDYYGSDGNGTPGAYYDDVCFGPGWIMDDVVEHFADNTSVYPNPARDMVNIVTESKIELVHIYNNAGQIVASEQGNAKHLQVNISQYNPGIYLLRIQTEDGVSTRRIVVE